MSMLAARAQALKRLKQQHPFVEEGVLLSKLMAYCSREAHSCVEKAAMICFVKLRILEPDEKSSLRGKTLMMVRACLNCNEVLVNTLLNSFQLYFISFRNELVFFPKPFYFS